MKEGRRERKRKKEITEEDVKSFFHRWSTCLHKNSYVKTKKKVSENK